MEKRVILKSVNNKFFVPSDFFGAVTSFIFTYINPDTILVYPEKDWSPQNVLIGVEIKSSIYEKVLDFICINSYVVKVMNGKFQIPNNFIEKLSFDSKCCIVKTDYGFLITSIPKVKNTLVLKL